MEKEKFSFNKLIKSLISENPLIEVVSFVIIIMLVVIIKIELILLQEGEFSSLEALILINFIVLFLIICVHELNKTSGIIAIGSGISMLGLIVPVDYIILPMRIGIVLITFVYLLYFLPIIFKNKEKK